MRTTFLGICLVISTFLTSCALYEPSRVFNLSAAPVECVSEQICIDDLSKRALATRLYDDAFAFVNQNIGQIKTKPRVIFCANATCGEHFGLGESLGYTVGTKGIVIKPTGWRFYILRHEIIHHLQNERLGQFGLQRTPKWFREGMAYALSGDPRVPLGNKYNQESYRVKFLAWYKTIDPEMIWEEARGLR